MKTFVESAETDKQGGREDWARAEDIEIDSNLLSMTGTALGGLHCHIGPRCTEARDFAYQKQTVARAFIETKRNCTYCTSETASMSFERTDKGTEAVAWTP